MLTASSVQIKADSQLSGTAVYKAIDAAILAAADAGTFSASYTFPVDHISAGNKDNLELRGFTVAVTTAQTLGVKATFTGQATGMSTDVTITADETGTAGNSISLAFDGVLTVSEALDAFNLANPENTASLISGDGDQVPDNLQTINLASGVDAVAEIISIDFGPQA